jgi:hypothetical protein
MKPSQIVSRIDQVMPPVERPPKDRIVVHPEGCSSCEFLLHDLLARRDSCVTPDLLLRICDEQCSLTPEAYRWILPEFLKAVIDEEADEFVVGFFVLSIAHNDEYFEQTRDRMALLTYEDLELIRQALCHLQDGDPLPVYLNEDSFVDALNVVSKIQQGEQVAPPNP